MDNSIKKIISSYNHNPTIEDIIKILEYDTDCKFILICWKLDYGYWHIKCIYDKMIEDRINYNNESGWYIKEEPTINNIPIRHSKLINNNIISTNGTKIIYASFTKLKEISDEYKFIINAYVEKIYLQYQLQSIKKHQELFLDKLSDYIKEPVKEILMYINKAREIQAREIQAREPLRNENHKYEDNQLNKTILNLTNNIFDMIDINKLELKKLKPKKSIFSFNNLVNDASKVVNSENKHNIELIIENNVPDVIYNDHKKIKQILINILELLLNSKFFIKKHSSPESYFNIAEKEEIIIYITSTIINLNNEDYDRENSIFSDLYKSELQYLINITMCSNKALDEKIKKNLFCPISFLQNDIINCRISYLLANLLGGNIRLLYSDCGKGTCIELEIITCDREPTKNNTIKKLKDKKILLLFDNSTITNFLDKYNIQYNIATITDELLILHKDKQFDLIIKNNNNMDSYIDMLNVKTISVDDADIKNIKNILINIF
jgi:hypothetical protein